MLSFGAIILLFVRGIYFSVSGGVGFICLFGISIMSGVLLISCIHHLRTDVKLSLREAVIQGTSSQFRMNVMTMSMALIGLIPAALATGIGSDIQRPLATVIVGGLLSNLILSLFALPIIYYVMEKRVIDKNNGIDPILNYYIDPILMTHVDAPHYKHGEDASTNGDESIDIDQESIDALVKELNSGHSGDFIAPSKTKRKRNIL